MMFPLTNGDSVCVPATRPNLFDDIMPLTAIRVAIPPVVAEPETCELILAVAGSPSTHLSAVGHKAPFAAKVKIAGHIGELQAASGMVRLLSQPDRRHEYQSAPGSDCLHPVELSNQDSARMDRSLANYRRRD